MMPTAFPSLRISAVSRSTSVLLPAPGGPVTPTSFARPVFAKMACSSSVPAALSSSTSEIARAIARGSPDSTPAVSGSFIWSSMIDDLRIDVAIASLEQCSNIETLAH